MPDGDQAADEICAARGASQPSAVRHAVEARVTHSSLRQRQLEKLVALGHVPQTRSRVAAVVRDGEEEVLGGRVRQELADAVHLGVCATSYIAISNASLRAKRPRRGRESRRTAEQDPRPAPRLALLPLLLARQLKHPDSPILARDAHPPRVERVDAELDDGAADGDAGGVDGEPAGARERVEREAAARA